MPTQVRLAAREAASLERCGSHPNIVRTYGVCVMPPAIAIVLELCEHGNLYFYLRSVSSLFHDHSSKRTGWGWGTNSTDMLTAPDSEFPYQVTRHVWL